MGVVWYVAFLGFVQFAEKNTQLPIRNLSMNDFLKLLWMWTFFFVIFKYISHKKLFFFSKEKEILISTLCTSLCVTLCYNVSMSIPESQPECVWLFATGKFIKDKCILRNRETVKPVKGQYRFLITNNFPNLCKS